MGQKVRPTGFRTGVMVGWKSSWFASKQDFSDLLVEDQKIRDFVKKTYRTTKQKAKLSGISKIVIERTREKVVVYIYSSRVGMIIGQKGSEIEELTNQLQNLIKRVIEIKTIEVNRPEVDAQIIAEEIGEQLERRASFRKTLKQSLGRAMENGAKGVRIQLSGRLGGAEMARVETGMDGSIPLSTLRTKVEYGFAEASTPQGNIGIKVWVNNGDYLTPEENSDAGADAQAGKVSKKPARKNPRERDAR